MTIRICAFGIFLALGVGNIMAQQSGDWQIGAGWLHVVPQDSSKPLVLTSPVTAVLPGSGADIGSSDTLGVNVTYFIDNHWAIEGAIGIPPKFKLTGTGTLERLGELGEARQWSPTLLGKYYFNEGTDRFRPYVGIGATYTWYSGIKLTPGLQGALAVQIGQPPSTTRTTAKLDGSFAPAFNIGVAYKFDRHWGAAFSVSYIPIKTKARLTTTSVGGIPVATSEGSFKVNPVVPYLSLTYKF